MSEGKLEFRGTAAGSGFQSTGEFYCSGGRFLAMCYGSFDSGTASIQITDDGVTYAVMKNTVQANLQGTSNFCMHFDAPPGLRARAIISGGGASKDITWVIWKLRPL